LGGVLWWSVVVEVVVVEEEEGRLLQFPISWEAILVKWESMTMNERAVKS
jgi:hypothetical protein